MRGTPRAAAALSVSRAIEVVFLSTDVGGFVCCPTKAVRWTLNRRTVVSSRSVSGRGEPVPIDDCGKCDVVRDIAYGPEDVGDHFHRDQ